MPISHTQLDVESYYVRAFHFDANEEYDEAKPATGALDVDVAVFPHPEDSLRFQVAMLVNIDGKALSLNEPYSVHLDIYGFFGFEPDTPEETFKRMMFSNAVPILYGIARGFVGQATATGFHGPLMLPAYDFIELFKRKNAAREAQQQLVGGSAEAPAPAQD